MHHDFEASTSNQETHDISNSALRSSFNVLNIPMISYVLPTCNSYKYCCARKFYRESKGFYCSDGKVYLCIPDSPTELYNLFTSKEPQCVEFKKIARGYNNHFAFTLFGIKYDKELFKSYRGIYAFKVQGQVYHYVNELIPQNSTHSYMQFFRSLSHTTNLQDHRIHVRCDPGLDQRVFNTPTASQVNSYSRFFRSLSHTTNLQDHRIHVRCDPGLDQRVFNTPTASQYSLLFPYGEFGWHEGIERCRKTYFQPELLNGMKQRSQISCQEYYSYKLQIRHSGKSVLLHSGRLFQQYVVDMYVKIETARLDYFRNNQKQIQAELYQGIVDNVQNGETRGYKIERKFVLPQSFTFGPRDMLRRYMDAMAIVQRYGKSDIFLTITYVNNIVSCEIPDQNKYPYLHSIIVKTLIQKMYAWKQINVVKINALGIFVILLFSDNLYPLYKRRDNDISIKVRGQMLDNQCVVP
ncbi:uncharacterized protein LOC111409542 [Olea europaea var. sylvestris]|uniref:uncharacterized protein LOC111409542 n=1 Tax=Olea europaea var. sylvestris TaxID=158386 RepID=UPI000C1CDC93|nr:uncharacterized protein LOC111409542 [Olea europaea var. sylvestris]